MNGSREALEHACAIAGIDAEGARLLRLGSNAVYRLQAPVVARVSRRDSYRGRNWSTIGTASDRTRVSRTGGRADRRIGVADRLA